MNIDGENFTLTDLSLGKIHQNYVNDKFVHNFDTSITPLDFTSNKNYNHLDNILYIDNTNYFTYDKNIYNGGYIFSTLPYPYDIVYKNGEYHIELIFPKIYEDLSTPKISSSNLYMDMKSKSKNTKKKIEIPKKTSKSNIAKPMR